MLGAWQRGTMRARLPLLTVLGTLTFFCVLYVLSSDQTQQLRHGLAPLGSSINGTQILPLPAIYDGGSSEDHLSDLCGQRYGSQYIRKFGSTATNMCEQRSKSSLTCFTHKAWDHSTDTFCTGTGAVIDPKQRSVFMDCRLHNFTEDENDLERHADMVDTIPESWYATGPRYLFDKFMVLNGSSEIVRSSKDSSKERIALLVKREGGKVISNVWHVFMQMMSLWVSLDIMQATMDPETGRPLYTEQDVKKTQVVILDEDPDGAFYELWDMFGALPTIRLRDSPRLESSKVLIPISGGSNPIWQSKDVVLPCKDSSLLRAFSQRILDFYNIDSAAPKRSTINMVWIDRTQKRMLVDQTKHLSSLRALLAERYPEVHFQSVDFANFTLREQIEKIRSTDILVGVHGAGLTHTMFLPPNSTAVEIQPPGLKYFGFESMAKLLGHGYFQEYGYFQKYEGMKHNWQMDNVFVKEDRFLKVIEQAINLRVWTDDDEQRRLGYPTIPADNGT